MPGCIADQFVGDADDQGSSAMRAISFAANPSKGSSGYTRIAITIYEQQETGSAARMEGHELLRVFDRHRLAGFEIEDHFVFGAVVLEHPANVFHSAK